MIKPSAAWAAAVLGGLAVALALLWGVEFIGAPAPRTGDADQPRARTGPAAAANTPTAQAWAEREHGIWVLGLGNDPAARGRAAAQILQADGRLDDWWHSWAAPRFYPLPLEAGETLFWLQARTRLRPLPGPWLAEHSGWSSAASVRFGARPDRRPLIQWLALEETQARDPEHMVGQGLAFGARARLDPNGHLLLGHRWGLPGDLERLGPPMVVRVQDTDRPYLMLTWPGWFEPVAGVNRDGVGVAWLAAPGAGQRRGWPAPLAVREVLMRSASLAEAVVVLRDFPFRYPAVFVIGSGRENRLAVVEAQGATLNVCGTREAWVAAVSRPVVPSAFPVSEAASQSAQAHLERAGEFLRRRTRSLDADACVALLRDRRDPHGDTLALGHPAAVETLGAASAAVLDLTRPAVWVSRGPSAWGAFIHVPLNPNDPAAPLEPIPADPALLNGTWTNWRTYVRERRNAERLVRQGRYREALLVVNQVRHLNPADHRLAVLRGDALAAMGRQDEARYNYREALRMHPFPASLRERLRRLGAGPDPF